MSLRVVSCAVAVCLSGAPLAGAQIIQVQPAQAPGAQAPSAGGRISAKAFKAAIEQGPQRLVASMELEPHMVEGRFVGHTLVRFTPDGLLASCQAFKAGDVFISINGESLARPAQFMQAWSSLKEAKLLKVEILRGETPMVLTWQIGG